MVLGKATFPGLVMILCPAPVVDQNLFGKSTCVMDPSFFQSPTVIDKSLDQSPGHALVALTLLNHA